ncbi:MAG TPA: LURP-one-related family protein [Candidatus Limnocylindrales bacterium]
MSFVPVAQTYVLNQKLMSLGGDLWIDDANGNHAFEVDGKALSLRRTLVLMDPLGNPLYQINQSLAHLHTTFEIKRGDEIVATVQKALINILGDRFSVALASGEQLAVVGDWIDREFHVTRAGFDVIVASHRFFSLHGAYGVQIAPGFDTPLALALVIALEQMELQEGQR